MLTELKWDWSLLPLAVTLGASRWFRLPLLMSSVGALVVDLPGRVKNPVIGMKMLTLEA